MKFNDLKGVSTLIVIGGTVALFVLLAFVNMPDKNRDLFNVLLGVWLGSGFSVVAKRLFDGTDSSDAKNETIQTLAASVTAKSDAS